MLPAQLRGIDKEVVPAPNHVLQLRMQTGLLQIRQGRRDVDKLVLFRLGVARGEQGLVLVPGGGRRTRHQNSCPGTQGELANGYVRTSSNAAPPGLSDNLQSQSKNR